MNVISLLWERWISMGLALKSNRLWQCFEFFDLIESHWFDGRFLGVLFMEWLGKHFSAVYLKSLLRFALSAFNVYYFLLSNTISSIRYFQWFETLTVFTNSRRTGLAKFRVSWQIFKARAPINLPRTVLIKQMPSEGDFASFILLAFSFLPFSSSFSSSSPGSFLNRTDVSRCALSRPRPFLTYKAARLFHSFSSLAVAWADLSFVSIFHRSSLVRSRS